MRVAIGADHAGFLLKEHLKQTLATLGHTVDDHGTDSEASVDYPPICMSVGRAVVEGKADRGIVLGGSGQGEQIAANKVPGVRAAVAWNEEIAALAREHNDANVLSLAARFTPFEELTKIVRSWFAAKFDGGRHERRVNKIRAIEQDELAHHQAAK